MIEVCMKKNHLVSDNNRNIVYLYTVHKESYMEWQIMDGRLECSIVDTTRRDLQLVSSKTIQLVTLNTIGRVAKSIRNKR